MTNVVLDQWQFRSVGASSLVVPDGCRDVIMRQAKGRKPEWFVSPLFDCAEWKASESGTLMLGFRLRAGIHINETILLSLLEDEPDIDTVFMNINECSYQDATVAEALECFVDGASNIQQAAKQLGLSVRSMQRLFLKQTQRSPHYWLSLARVRRAAIALLNSDLPYVELAYEQGYADQAHMCRDIKQWFGVTPREIRQQPTVFAHLNDLGL